jgi:ATP-dependent helicase/nuclease subunit A
MASVRWTDEQKAAILTRRDTLLAASAGTGKTTTVVGKILWLLGLELGLEPPERTCRLDEIAAITFTEKGAHDLKRKLRAAIEGSERAEELRWEIDRASIGTIHGFCASLLREHALRLGIDPTFSILDETQTRTVLNELIREVILEQLEEGDEGTAELFRAFRLEGFAYTSGTVGLVRDAIRSVRWHPEEYGRWCDSDGLKLDLLRGLSPAAAGADAKDELVLARCDTLYRLASRALERWRRYLKAENARDYDALILDGRDLLTGPHADAALESIRRRYRILIVDEFQDTDFAQRDIAFAIGHRQPRPQLFFVGDPKQSIYRFRGADISVWNTVADALRGDGAQLSLTRNFRSQPELIEFLNDVGGSAIAETGAALAAELPGSRVGYTPLEPALPSSATAAVEWLQANGGKTPERRAAEGEQLAQRIRALVGGEVEIVDPETGERRPCRYRDIAVLYRTRTGLEHYQQALALGGVPVFNAAQGGLAEQQEVEDVVNALRLIDNPANDLAAFSFLRSPFVGLRDEVLARIGLERRHRTMLYQARAAATEDRWWCPDDRPELARLEQGALRSALEVFDDCVALAARLPLDELVQELLDRTGYRLHLMLIGENREALGNLQTFLRIAEEHRKQPLGSFLDIWKRWDEQDSGIPQAPLYSAADDVVTLTTIHRAKGLEWPVVFLIDTCSKPSSRSAGSYWADPEHGPILGPKQADAGPRAQRLMQRLELEQMAEEARLLYVASTRARDRLIITGPDGAGGSHAGWLKAGRNCPVVSARTRADDLPLPEGPPLVELTWLDRIVAGSSGPLAEALPEVALRFLTSATELMMRENDPALWEMRYVHGVEPVWSFARAGEGVPAHVRGTLIHGVLERIREQEELSRLLDEVVGELDAPELQPVLQPGTSYREALEAEIARVVASDEWTWYTAGEHYRELPFLHLNERRAWRIGAFDLYRPDQPTAWIVDFKTHEIEVVEAKTTAESYLTQAAVYRAAAGVRSPARIRLHFTRPNVGVDLEPG